MFSSGVAACTTTPVRRCGTRSRSRPAEHCGAQTLSRPRPSTREAVRVKGVGKFGEVMAGDKGEADYDASLEKLERVIRSGSRPSAILDFLVKELRRAFPHYTWVGVYRVEGEELVLKAWSGPHATQHVRIPIGEGGWGLRARAPGTA